MSIATTIARHWPFANGSGRIIDRFTRGVDLGVGERVAQTSDGFPLHVLANDLIGRHIILSGKFDRTVVQVLLDHACPGDILLDVGANIGYVSGCFLSNINDSKAICIEPQPTIVDLLRSNMGQFNRRAVVHQVALSDITGELRFQINDGNRGNSKITADGDLVVPSMNAADLLRSLDKLDLVKIDVEGHELVVFKAMEMELSRLRPRAILFEDQTGSAAPTSGIGSILARTGYGVFGIQKRLFETTLVPIRDAVDCRYNDYLAVAS